jgi:hypothetical protein
VRFCASFAAGARRLILNVGSFSSSRVIFQSIEYSLQTNRRPVVHHVQANSEYQRQNAVDDGCRPVARLRTRVAD